MSSFWLAMAYNAMFLMDVLIITALSTSVIRVLSNSFVESMTAAAVVWYKERLNFIEQLGEAKVDDAEDGPEGKKNVH